MGLVGIFRKSKSKKKIPTCQKSACYRKLLWRYKHDYALMTPYKKPSKIGLDHNVYDPG